MDSITNNILNDRSPWEEGLKKINQNIVSLKSIAKKTNKNSEMVKVLALRTEIIFNQIFQLVHRYKFEEELSGDTRIAVVHKDEKNFDGTRKLQIYPCTVIKSDFQTLKLRIGDSESEFKNEKDGKFIVDYNPKNFKDSLIIKLISENTLNSEIVETEVKYKIPKK